MRPAVVAAGFVAVVVLAAGCGGGSSSPSVARLATSSSATTTSSSKGSSPSTGAAMTPQEESAVDDAYASCMTSHGVEARAIQGGGVGFIVRPGSPRPGSAQVDAAQRACKRLLPKGGLPAPTQAQISARTARLLKLAGCMRSHGVPKFPDPTSNGNLFIGPNSGINPLSPQFQQAQKACARDFPGGSPPPPP